MRATRSDVRTSWMSQEGWSEPNPSGCGREWLRSPDRCWRCNGCCAPPPAHRKASPMKTSRLLAATAASGLVVAALAACAPAEKGGNADQTRSGVTVSEATSATGFGGMDALVEAAKKEGELNVIALPPDWATTGTSSRRSGTNTHQGQLRAARRGEPGPDQRREPAKGEEHGAGRVRPGTVRSAGQHVDVRAVHSVNVR